MSTMKVKHNPTVDIEKVCEIYSKRDGVPIKYVCTTDLRSSDAPVDIFYRSTPHPQFRNNYFGLFIDNMSNDLMIIDADMVEDLEFGLVENDDGLWEYSESHHTFKSFKNGNMIDGGRQYIRSSGSAQVFQVYMGELRPFNELIAEGIHD